MRRVLVILMLCCCGIAKVVAQCPDFTDLGSLEVVCQHGPVEDPFRYAGLVPLRHVVITHQGTDANTGGQLPLLPEGANAVVRLGNANNGGDADAITYPFTVDPDNTLLMLQYAVVLQDTGQNETVRPHFEVRVLNAAGQLLDFCDIFSISVDVAVPGFLSYGSVRYLPWTTMGIDLSRYVGQQVRLQFVAYDCSCRHHFGYAYFTASCMGAALSIEGCDGGQVTLSAPEGFAAYEWSNGASTRAATLAVSSTTSACCAITSVSGCQFTLNAAVSSTQALLSSDTIYRDTICVGDSYSQHHFSLPPQIEEGTFIYRNTYFNTNECEADATATLYLTVLPQVCHIYDVVCEGTDYDRDGFYYTNLAVGERVDTLTTTLVSGCVLTKILHLSVTPWLTLFSPIVGPKDACCNMLLNYSHPSADSLSVYHWEVPAGVNVVFGDGSPSVSLYITENAPNPTVIQLVSDNACGSSLPLSVAHYPSYYEVFYDTICTGQNYSEMGFLTPRQDSAGVFTFTNHLTTANGCDSIRELQLFVASTPVITTMAQPEEICEGQHVNLHAFGENAGFSQDPIPPSIAIGDILCTDGTTEKPSNWVEASATKTAKGIIFYVDSTGEHGWAVSLDEQGSMAWGDTNVNIVSLDDYIAPRAAITDYNGSYNTQQIRNAGDATAYPAAWAMDVANGWYLPSIGQFRVLYAVIPTVNASLALLDGTLFIMGGDNIQWRYWTSTESSARKAWYVTNGGNVAEGGTNINNFKQAHFRVRGFCSF